MEDFVVSSAAASAPKRKRHQHPPDRIESAVTMARQVGASAAVASLNKKLSPDEHLSEDTVRKWLFTWKKDGNFWEKRGKRGRPSTASSVPGALDEWKRQVDSFRAQGESVTGRLSSTILKAVLEEKAPSLLVNHGGGTKVSIRSGSYMLAAAGMSFRKRTSARIIPPADEVASARDEFYGNIRDCFPGEELDPHLVLNFDQTFQLYNQPADIPGRKKVQIGCS